MPQNDSIPYYILAVGLVLALLAWLWLLVRAFRTHKGWGWGLLVFPPTVLPFVLFRTRPARGPLGLMLVAAVVVATAMVYPQIQQRFATFGERERVVQKGENPGLHITLTGWDKDDYSLLAKRPDAVVVQMANPDVTDETLHFLEGMTILKELDLNDTSITDEGLATLARLPAIEWLRLANTGITDEGFRKHLLGKESLLRLDMTGTKQVTSKTLRQWKAAREGRKVVN
ncbi:MAG: hypothetical protein U0797_13420 [Gemmataceae bacterium]